MIEIIKGLTEEDIDLIEKNYLIKSDDEIGEILGKESSLVKKCRMKFGFLKQRQTIMRDVGEDKKWCWYCGEIHNKDMFSKNSRKPDGLQDECKIAVKKMSIARKLKKQETLKLKEKICMGCGKVKNIDQFIKNISTNDGYANRCKECMNEGKDKPRFITGGEKND